MSAASGSVAPIHGLHHFAWRCRDAEETRHFYEDLLGLPLAFVSLPLYVLLPHHYAREFGLPLATLFVGGYVFIVALAQFVPVIFIIRDNL